ncbi:MAG: hypothetical protein ABSA59_01345 [Terriglobia bacterium]
MRRSFLCLAAVLIATLPVLAQHKSQWTDWLPALNGTAKDASGIEHERTNFSYRWKLSIPCSGKDCSFKLQMRNNSDRRESVNYTISVAQHGGQTTLTRDHRNFDPNETQDIPVESYGKEITNVKIE